MAKKLKFVGLDPTLTESLYKNNLTSCKDVLSKSNLELMLQLRISIQSANEIILKASKACSPHPTNALEMVEQSKQHNSCLRTTLDTFDKLLDGGLRCKTITEISGPPGCGKTQFCMMLAVVFLTLDEAKNRSVLYIDTERAFDPARLLEIASSKYPDDYANIESLHTLANRVIVYREKNFLSLTKRLENIEDEIILKKAGLVIIDSIASPVRREFDVHLPRNIYERNKMLSKLATSLKLYASFYNFPVIITNQITTQFKRNIDTPWTNDIKTSPMQNILEPTTEDASATSEGAIIVALGIHWSHCINTRIILQYSTSSPNLRELHLVKSSHAPDVKLHYTIEDCGIVLRSDGEFGTRSNTSLNINTKPGINI